MIRTFLATLFTCAGLVGNAHGAAEATARIGQVQLGVIDLTPADGAAAGFAVTSFDSRLIAYADTRATGGILDRTIVTPAAHTPGVAQSAMGTAHADATTTGVIGDVAAGTAAAASLGLGNLVSGESEQRLWLTLAPHTLLTVSGDVLTQAHRTLTLGEGYRVFTWATVDITDSDMVTSSFLTRESALIWGEASADAAHAEHFMLAYANPGDDPLALSVNFLAYADVTVAAVPEPPLAAMVGVGLLVLGLVLALARKAERRLSRAAFRVS